LEGNACQPVDLILEETKKKLHCMVLPVSACYALKTGHALFFEGNCVQCDAM
jgi:hypothetical protein